MPSKLAERCILAGSKIGDHIFDPFGGAGTTAMVSMQLERHATLIELNTDYATVAHNRLLSMKPNINNKKTINNLKNSVFDELFESKENK